MSVREEKPKAPSPGVLDLPSKVREYYNTLRDRILLSMNGATEPPRLIAITSSYKGEGVSTVAANLAVALSHIGNVLLVDANLGRPSVHKIFKMKIAPGLAESLVGGQSDTNQVAKNLDLICAGQMNGRLPLEYETSQKLNELLEAYKRVYQFVVFDIPAVNETSAAIRLASLMDGVILVVEAERTRWEVVQRVKDQLLQVKANVLGVVLNKRRFPIPKLLYRK